MLSFRLDSFVQTCQSDDLTALQDIPAMQRRRLSPLAKCALHTARTALDGQTVDYIVWTSVCGDETITVNIMTDIASGQTPSPTQFSVSVHNAISGLYSILYHDDTPAVSLSSALSNAWSDAVLDAYMFLSATGGKRALIVYYDAPLPEVYRSSYCIDEMYALGAILTLDNANCTMTADTGDSGDLVVSPSQFHQFWQSDERSVSDGCWIYQK